MDKEQILSEIKKIIENHVGEENAISAGDITEMLGLKKEDTHAVARKYILETIKKYRIPVGATTKKGYFFINNREELEKYKKTLDNRIRNTEKRKQEIEAIFEEFYSK